MKKLLFLMLVVPLIGWFGISDGHCEEEIIYACYKKENGQMRLVSNVNECLSSELSVYWSKDGYVPVYFKDLYVNISTGVDEEGYGLSDDSPFETISYAIEQVPYLRKSPDFKTTIHIAGGNYQENINLDIDNVEFIAEPKGGVLITAPANDQSAFEVTTASGIILDGIVITGGYRGFFCKSNSSCKLINCEIKNAAWRGIQVDENSGIFIKDCTTDSCGRDGLGIFLSSNATITGDSNEFNNNMRNGVTVGLSSSLIMDSAKVTTIGNQRDGIQATGGSEVTTVNSNILAENNMRDGILINGTSRFSVWSDSEVYARDNMRYGTAIVGSSFASVTDGSMLETSENEDIGLLVSQSASSEISGKIVSQNNNNIGMLVGISSGVRMDGVVNILNNMDAGMVINQASSVQTSANNILTVKGTKPGSEGYSIGISITENSTLSSSGTVEVSENIGGTLESWGIFVGRSSNITFKTDDPNGVNVLVAKNGGDGIEISQGSSGRFSSGVIIQGNGRNGLNVNTNSEFYGQGMKIVSNVVQDVNADNGSNADCTDSCELGKVSLSFGSRGSFFNGTSIVGLTCDGTALIRPATFSCPSP